MTLTSPSGAMAAFLSTTTRPLDRPKGVRTTRTQAMARWFADSLGFTGNSGLFTAIAAGTVIGLAGELPSLAPGRLPLAAALWLEYRHLQRIKPTLGLL
ncbi:hypothetical protein JKP88DRAFT_273984 [Tribonema minus]|uniref:Uncharacterized protein n=1 Tax=Tribonema minus TaxID=303371 RepID=A0A836C9A3_9STRA|nr:hypothetical protein JKP88DRAFT_273984 [Tribonema minus]